MTDMVEAGDELRADKAMRARSGNIVGMSSGKPKQKILIEDIVKMFRMRESFSAASVRQIGVDMSDRSAIAEVEYIAECEAIGVNPFDTKRDLRDDGDPQPEFIQRPNVEPL